MTTTNKSHNGYTNYETWAVALWIDNEQGSQEYWIEQATEAYRMASPTSYSNRREVATHDLAEMLKSEHEENAPTVTGVFADLLNAALSEVDWDDVAENILTDELVAEIQAEEAADDSEEA